MSNAHADDLYGSSQISRDDVEGRIAFLKAHVDALAEHVDPGSVELEEQEVARELEHLEELLDEMECCQGDYAIHEDAFMEYAKSFAEDVGAIQDATCWPAQFIDWEAACEALQQDFVHVMFGESGYWVR